MNMKTAISLNLTHIIAIIRLPSRERTDNVVGFGEIQLVEEEEKTGKIEDKIWVKVRGFRVRKVTIHNRPQISVDFPAYRAGVGFQKSFIAEDKKLFNFIRVLLLEEYSRMTGEVVPEYIGNGEEVDEDDIPF